MGYLVQALVVAGLILVFGVAMKLNPQVSSVEWASWVQAFGSVAAIWGAFVIGTRQARVAAQTVEADRRLVRSDAVSQAREVAEAASTTILQEIAGAKEYVDKRSGEFIAHPERLDSYYAMIDATLGLSMPGKCSKSLLDVRSALTDLHMIMREMGGTLISGHSKVRQDLELAESKCKMAMEQLNRLDAEHKDAIYLSGRNTLK